MKRASVARALPSRGVRKPTTVYLRILFFSDEEENEYCHDGEERGKIERRGNTDFVPQNARDERCGQCCEPHRHLKTPERGGPQFRYGELGNQGALYGVYRAEVQAVQNERDNDADEIVEIDKDAAGEQPKDE